MARGMTLFGQCAPFVLFTCLLLASAVPLVAPQASLTDNSSSFNTGSQPVVEGQTSWYVGDAEIALLDKEHLASWNGTHLRLHVLKNGSVLDSVLCDRALDFTGTREYGNGFNVNLTRELITCGNAIYEWNSSGFSVRFSGSFSMAVDPVHNSTALITGTTSGGCGFNTQNYVVAIQQNGSTLWSKAVCTDTVFGIRELILSEGGDSFSVVVHNKNQGKGWQVCNVSSCESLFATGNNAYMNPARFTQSGFSIVEKYNTECTYSERDCIIFVNPYGGTKF